MSLCAFALVACADPAADILILGDQIYTGEPGAAPIAGVIAIDDERIIYIGAPKAFDAPMIIDAKGHAVLPGFIDPHTHSLGELTAQERRGRANLNYQMQGVTTVITGNDGYGAPDIQAQFDKFESRGIGTNAALLLGHGALRQTVMGDANRAPNATEMSQMQSLVRSGMEAGALGISTGLFYSPGSYAETGEVIALAKTVATYDGIYDSHIRDEASYNIGLEAAVDELIEIGETAKIRVHIAHIKALGVDVWGMSDTLIANIEAAQARGVRVTADQYPWTASGTRISNALLPRWVKADGAQAYQARLSDPNLLPRIRAETTENLRRRGGPKAVLLTSGQDGWAGQTLGQLAAQKQMSPVEAAIFIAQNGDARIASFNMNPQDIEAFMVRDWVMSSSDGSTGHPRKFASYPKKYTDYVRGKNIITMEDFVYRSSGLVAQTFGICERGFLRKDYYADIAILDLDAFTPQADFQNPEALGTGVTHLLVNGTPVIRNSVPQDALPGKAIRRCRNTP